MSALEFQPGSRWSYSPQAGFDTLGRIVEIVSGQPFDQFLRQRMFDPLGMKDVSFYPTPDARAAHGRRRISSDPKGKMAKNANPGRDAEQGLLHGIGRAHHDGRGVREVRADARQRRRVERQAAAQPADRSRTCRQCTRPTRCRAACPAKASASASASSTAPWRAARACQTAASAGAAPTARTSGWIQKEDLIAVLMIQTPVRDMRPEFENAVMQAIIK